MSNEYLQETVVKLDKCFLDAHAQVLLGDEFIQAVSNAAHSASHILLNQVDPIEAAKWDKFSALMARSISLVSEDKQLAMMQKMWLASISTEDVNIQEQYCSIIYVMAPRHKSKMKSILHGIVNLSTGKKYSTSMVALIREYRK